MCFDACAAYAYVLTSFLDVSNPLFPTIWIARGSFRSLLSPKKSHHVQRVKRCKKQQVDEAIQEPWLNTYKNRSENHVRLKCLSSGRRMILQMGVHKLLILFLNTLYHIKWFTICLKILNIHKNIIFIYILQVMFL
jgi:hypothetical protein